MSVGPRTLFLALSICAASTWAFQSNHIPHSSGRTIATGDQLVSSVILECFDGDFSIGHCMRVKTLEFLDSTVGKKRSLDYEDADDKLDNLIVDRVQRYLQSHYFTLQLPEFLFQKAAITFKPSRRLDDIDVELIEPKSDGERSPNEGGESRKQNSLMPLLIFLKLKLKALIPILLALVHLKATKALIISKVSLLVLVGFLFFQILQKKGMGMTAMPAEPPMPPTPSYGPPASSYGPPSPPSTVSSYEAPIYEAPSSWEPAAPSGGPYARVGWDAQNMAYNGYLTQQTTNQQQGTNVARK